MDTPTNTFQILPLAQVRESRLNPRRRFNEQQLAELAESIRQHGIITPLIVRQVNGHYELAAGHRRRRAAELAGLEAVPAMIRELSDQQFLEVLTIENDQREDVHPLEQAEGYQRLLKLKGYTVDLVAEKIGRDASYVYRRLHLLKLIDPAKEAFLDGRIQIGHALKLAPLEPAVQAQAYKQLFREEDAWDPQRQERVKVGKVVASPSELEAYIRTEVYLDLARAPFPKDDADLLPKAGACTACSKRTGANLALFDDTKKGDHCLDRACFHQKQNALVVRIEKAAKAEGKSLVRLSNNHRLTYSKDAKALYAPHAGILKPGKGRCESAEAALYVDGPLAGKQVEVCRDPKCPKHKAATFSGGREQKTFAEVWAGKKQRLDERIEAEIDAELWRRIVASVSGSPSREDLEAIGKYLIRRATHDARRVLCGVLGLEPEKSKRFGSTHTDFEGALEHYLASTATGQLPGLLVGLTLVGYNELASAALRKQAQRFEIAVADVERAIADPMRADFAAKKAKAEAAHKKNMAAEKEAEGKRKREEKRAANVSGGPDTKNAAKAKAKKRAAVDAKRRAANDVDDEPDDDGAYDAGV